jgi:CheY-like chemotaxis protein
MTTCDLGPHRLLGLIRHDERLAVCAAIDRASGVPRLVKVLLPGETRSVARRLVRQARALSMLRYPGLPAVLDTGMLPSGAFVVTEPVQGVSADQWLQRVGPLASRPEVAAAIVATVANLCIQLANIGVVHGELCLRKLRLVPVAGEPSRFVLSLMDSEMAALRRGVAGSSSAAHLAPELSEGLVPDMRSEVYALGCLFVELLTGTPPFDAGGEPFPDLDALLPTVSIEMRRLIARMLARKPESRHQTMDAIVTAIELILCRHRTRFPELLSAADPASLTTSLGQPSISEDLTPLAPAFAGDAVEHWIAAASTALRRLGAAAREATIPRLLALRAHPQEPADGAPTILVAEDDDDTRQSVVELLEEQGYRVVAARHGLEAREYLRKGHGAQCMVMDLWMPEMDGWALAAEMEEGRLPAVPTIVMTAAEPHWGYPSAIVVRKPFDTRHLLGLVQRVSEQAKTKPP